MEPSLLDNGDRPHGNVLGDKTQLEDERDIDHFLNELSPFDYVSYGDSIYYDYHKIYDGQFEHVLYKTWLEGRSWRLRCHGPPQSGKTTFAAAIREDLAKRDDHMALTIYLDVSDHTGRFTLLNSPHISMNEALSRAILRQVLQRKRTLSQESSLLADITSGTIEVDALSPQVVEELIGSEIKHFKGLFVIIDGQAEEDVLADMHDHLAGIANVQFYVLTMEDSARFPDLEERLCDFCVPPKTVELYWQCDECSLSQTSKDYCFDCKGYRTCPTEASHLFTETYKDRIMYLSNDSQRLESYVLDKLRQEVESNTPVGLQLTQQGIANVSRQILAKAQEDFALVRLSIECLIEQQSLDAVLGTFSRLPSFQLEYFRGLVQAVADSAYADTALAALSICARLMRKGENIDLPELNTMLCRHYGCADQEYLSKKDIGFATRGILTMEPYISDEGRQELNTVLAGMLTFLNEECEQWFELTAGAAILDDNDLVQFIT